MVKVMRDDIALASEVKHQVVVLNQAIADAQKAGLEVELENLGVSTASGRRGILTVRVLKAL